MQALHPCRHRRVPGGLAVAAALAVAASAGATPAAAAPSPQAAGDPDLGPNVTFIDPSWSSEKINDYLSSINDEEEFSNNRHQVFFEPGTYGSDAGAADPTTATDIVNAEVGYYEAIDGLGAQPDDVTINGALHVEPVVGCPDSPWACGDPGSLTRFWRSLSNVAINPIQRPVGEDVDRPNPAGVAEPHEMRWAVSQAAPMRRVDVQGDLTVFGRYGEFASGGYLANSRVSGTLTTGSQQQWYTRNSEVGTYDGGVWNAVNSGVEGANPTDFGTTREDGTPGVTTTLDSTPVSREKPFLYRGDDGNLAVFVPKAHTDSSGVDWSTDADAGESLPIGDFYVAQEGDSAADINAALADGQNLLITPGVYELDDPIQVSNPDTVVLGLGYASLMPTDGDAALEIGDVAGVKVAGITVDAGTTNSDTLVQVGPEGATESDAADPTTLTDVFVRVGGPVSGNATTSIDVNSDNTLLDHLWLWRGDHGKDETGTWTGSTGDQALVVDGDDVTATGLFVEHYQKNQVMWNGEGGRTIFYQSEMPYDVPDQASWNDGDRKGYASYRVADDVTSHEAVGLGVYSYFNQGEDIHAESGIQAPDAPQVSFSSATSVFLNGSGGIDHVVNGAGDSVQDGTQTNQLPAYPTGG